MSKVIRPTRRVLLALGVFASLGFGVTSALAEPAQTARQKCTFLREWDECMGCCQAEGHTSGVVDNGFCQCEN